MNEHDRTSIHEAMEQQSISISKAGIVTTLRARCSVVAAANPLQGRYNSQLSFSENVDLSDPILSRFDILNVVRDEVNSEIDYNLSTFVINLHMENHPYKQQYSSLNENLIPEPSENHEKVESTFLRDYIKYARERCHPELNERHLGLINQFYVKLREESKISGGMNVAVRHIESIIRVAVGKLYSMQRMPKCTSAARSPSRILKLASSASSSHSYRPRSIRLLSKFARNLHHIYTDFPSTIIIPSNRIIKYNSSHFP